MTTLEAVGGLLIIVVTILGAAWRMAARITRWADEVARNTKETRRLSKKHNRIKGRVSNLENRITTVESMMSPPPGSSPAPVKPSRM